MKPGIPWSVKGIDQEAREAAKDAARRSGMTLGEWLNTLIKEEADQAPPKPPVRPRPAPTRSGDDITSRLDQLADQLTNLTRQGSETAANRFAPHAVHAAVETHSIASLVDRVERNEREAAALIAELVQRLEQVEQANEELAQRPVIELPQHPEDVPGYVALEGALRNVVGHIETSDTRVRDTLKSVQDRLSNLAARAERSERIEAGQASLEARVGELAQALAEEEHARRREIELQVGSEAAKIAQRIEALTQAQDGLAQQARAVALQAAQREVRDVAARSGSEVARLAERLNALGQAQEGMVQKAQAMALQAAQREVREVSAKTAGEVARLAERLDTLGQAQDGMVQKAQALALQAAQREAREIASRSGQESARLTERLDALKAESDGLQQKAQSIATQAAQREAREVERRLQASLQEAQRGAASTQETARDLRRAVSAIESLEQRFDDIKLEAASEREMRALKLSVEQLSATVAQGVGAKPLAEFESRLSEFGKRLDNSVPSSQAVAHLSELETRVHHLDARLKEATLAAADSVSSRIFEAEVRQNGERMSAVEDKLDQLATLERSVAQLHQSLDESRTWAKGVAEETTREMANRLRAQGGFEAGSSPELKALEAGLSAVKASAAAADSRTQETLEAVHETLEQIVAKLAALESREPSEAIGADFTDPVAAAIESGFGGRGPTFSRSMASRAEFPETSIAAPDRDWQSEPDRTPSPRTSEADFGEFDPGPVPVTPAAAPDFDTAMTFDPDVETRPAQDAGTVKEDFIAAARRAAQSTSRSQSPILGGLSGLSQRPQPPEAEGAAAERKARFRLPFLRSKARSEMEPAPGEDHAPRSPASRKRLILAGLVLLMAVAAYAANRTNLIGRVLPSAATSIGDAVNAAKARISGFSALPASSERPLTLAAAKQDAVAKSDPLSIGLADRKLLSIASLASVQSPRTPTSDRLDDESFSAKANFDRARALEAPIPPASRRPAALPPAGAGPESLRKAAIAGDPNAAFIVASRFLEGGAVGQDYARAAEWFARAAEKGLAPAQYRLATLFERGRGVEQNREAALAWYLRAAGNGNVKSMHNLAVMYADRRQAAPQFDLAARWFRAAAERGLKDSQYNLAVLCERGLGTDASPDDAYYWYSLAAKQGDADAARRAEALEKSFDAGALASLKRRVTQWSPEPPIRLANFVAMVDPSWQAPAEAIEAPVVADRMASAEEPEGGLSGKSADETLLGKALIKRAQELLTSHGFNIAGDPDGVMGARTANAVRLFQMRNGLAVNGMVSNDLLRALEGPRI